MAKKLDQRPFLPTVPDEISNSEKARRLSDALGQIWDELSFVLFSLGPENFSAAGLVELRRAMKIPADLPVLWSMIGEDEAIPAGTLVIYNGRIRVALQDQTKDSSLPPSTGEYWDYAS